MANHPLQHNGAPIPYALPARALPSGDNVPRMYMAATAAAGAHRPPALSPEAAAALRAQPAAGPRSVKQSSRGSRASRSSRRVPATAPVAAPAAAAAPVKRRAWQKTTNTGRRRGGAVANANANANANTGVNWASEARHQGPIGIHYGSVVCHSCAVYFHGVVMENQGRKRVKASPRMAACLSAGMQPDLVRPEPPDTTTAWNLFDVHCGVLLYERSLVRPKPRRGRPPKSAASSSPSSAAMAAGAGTPRRRGPRGHPDARRVHDVPQRGGSGSPRHRKRRCRHLRSGGTL